MPKMYDIRFSRKKNLVSTILGVMKYPSGGCLSRGMGAQGCKSNLLSYHLVGGSFCILGTIGAYF